MDDALPVDHFDPPGICSLCQRILSSENDPIDLESISVCGDCKFLFLEDNGTPSQHIQHRTPRIITRTRSSNSSESIEDIFSHQFSNMINLARHNHPPAVSDTSSHTTPNSSRRWRRVVSDTENDGFGSVYGENDDDDDDDDGISYGGHSDADVDVHSFLDGDSDTDIDPMHAGLNQWSSDDEWDEVEDGETENTLGSLIARVQLQRSLSSNEQSPPVNWLTEIRSPEIEGAIRVRISERRLNPFVGHSGDYLDSRSFEELFERLAEADNSRRGAPPAAVSFVNNLDRVVVNETDHKGLACAICKDTLIAGSMVNRLPCLHLYHGSCIKPWLSSRNSCPLCRFELPTDDVDYENRKQSSSRHGSGVQDIHQEEEEEEDVSFEVTEIMNGGDIERRRGRGGGGGRWWFVAAPVMSLVGIGVALWLGNRGGIGNGGSSQRGNRQSRRWWSLF